MNAVMEAGELTSSDIYDRFPVGSVSIFRWIEAGWIRPIERRWGSSGSGRWGSDGHVWPAWTLRMVALLDSLPSGTQPDANRDGNNPIRQALADVATVLSEHPDVPWAVTTAAGTAPAWCAEDVVALATGHAWATVWAIPDVAS